MVVFSFLRALARLILERVDSLLKGQAKKGFKPIKGQDFTLRQDTPGSLVYQEAGANIS